MKLDQLLRERGRAVFLPIVYRLAAALEQLTWDELTGDPTVWTTALRGARQATASPVVLNHFDLGLEAEALGARVLRDETGAVLQVEPAPALPSAPFQDRGRLPVAIEVARRLCIEFSGRLPVLGTVTGPFTLARQLGVPDAAAVAAVGSELAEAYGRAGIGAIVVAEDLGGAAQEVTTAGMLKVLAPLLRVAAYFSVPVLLVTRPAESVSPAEALAAGVAGVVHPVAGPGVLRSVPEEVLRGDIDHLRGWLREHRDEGPFASPWEVAPDTPAENVRAAVEALAP